jgi:hypothetical protein
MSLKLVRVISPCLSYIDGGACYPPPGPPPAVWHYNPALMTCPKHYLQGQSSSVPKFIYDPGDDKYKAFFGLSSTYWPSWDAQRAEWYAETGEWANSVAWLARSTWVGVFGMSYSNRPGMGSFNKIYSTMNSTTAIWEVDPNSLLTVTNGWHVDPYYGGWNPRSIYNHAVVNRQDGYLIGGSSWTLDHWRNLNGTPERFATTRLPNTLAYMCYENRNYLWFITSDGVICKMDYKIPRYEMISTVQNPESISTGYAIAFDSKRKRVAVLRTMPDAVDGACQHQLEIYSPLVVATGMTDPVPVSSLKTGKQITFVSHVIGDAGEGVTPFTVNANMADPVEGRLINAFSGTELNGRVSHRYQAPNEACTETLQLDVTVEDE